MDRTLFGGEFAEVVRLLNEATSAEELSEHLKLADTGEDPARLTEALLLRKRAGGGVVNNTDELYAVMGREAILRLSRYAEAEAAARRRIALPDPGFGDVTRERSDRRQRLALALAKQGRSAEAREVLEPALEHHRKRRADGETGTEFRLTFAEALYTSAIAQEDDAAGRRARAQALEAATAELDGLSDEARQLQAARLLRQWIAAARVM